jgi:hypothetical protein
LALFVIASVGDGWIFPTLFASFISSSLLSAS